MDVAKLRHIFAERIKELRTELGLNQGEFADKVGVSRGAMSYYEQEARTPDLNVLYSICEKCGVSADYMIGLIPDRDRVVSNVCLETGLFPKSVKKLRQIKELQSINTQDIFSVICDRFENFEEMMNLTPYAGTTIMINTFLSIDGGLNVLTLLSGIIFDGELYSNDKPVENPVIRLPKMHSSLQADYELNNLTAALWVNLQEEVIKLRDYIHSREEMKPYFERKKD